LQERVVAAARTVAELIEGRSTFGLADPDGHAFQDALRDLETAVKKYDKATGRG
jgi:hypothetical protein